MKSKDHGTLHRWKRSLAICVLPRYIATCIPGMIRAVAIPQLVAGLPPIPSVPALVHGSIPGQGPYIWAILGMSPQNSHLLPFIARAAKYGVRLATLLQSRGVIGWISAAVSNHLH